MSYFDHVRCPSCKAHIDPEKVEVQEGVAVCPSCKAQIGIKDMFGLKAAFDAVSYTHLTLPTICSV